MAKQKTYRMGEFSKRLGVSRDLIKHYEKQGILTSRREKNNQYRYYYHAQYTSIPISRKLQNVGYSLREIGHLLNDASLEEYTAENADRIAALEREQLLRGMALENLRFVHTCQQEALEGKLLGRWELAERPELAFFPFSGTSEFLPLSPEETDAVTDWADAMPVVEYCGLLREETLIYGFSVRQERAELLELPSPHVERVRPCRTFNTYLKIPRRPLERAVEKDLEDMQQNLAPALSEVERQGLTPTSPILLRYLFEGPEDGKFCYYCQASIPI
ncbi:MAG: MerR family transcriptional regulator [Clostridiales bacterium]|nr:MerR family transcriptional regulator [Clostridiales bacterium]